MTTAVKNVQIPIQTPVTIEFTNPEIQALDQKIQGLMDKLKTEESRRPWPRTNILEQIKKEIDVTKTEKKELCEKIETEQKKELERLNKIKEANEAKVKSRSRVITTICSASAGMVGAACGAYECDLSPKMSVVAVAAGMIAGAIFPICGR